MLVILAQVWEREWAAKELAAARDQALSASQAKSDFLATMSHEIRTPLNGVIGLSELLRRTELTRDEQRLDDDDDVDQAGRTLLALVNDILDLSKIEAGRLDLEAIDFDPRAVLEQSAGLLADRSRQKGLELVISSAADVLSLVRGDPVRFGQVITNLTANAVKFTTEGEVAIRAHGAAEGRGHGSGWRSGTAGSVSPRRPNAALRGLHPGRQLHDPGVRWHRAEPGHQQPHRLGDVRRHRSDQRTRRREHVPPSTSPSTSR